MASTLYTRGTKAAKLSGLTAAVLCSIAIGATVPAMAQPEVDPELTPQLTDDEYEQLRLEMVTLIVHQTMALRPEIGAVDLSDALLEAFSTVPRHDFVPEEIRLFSYFDTPLPVAEGATVSQPFITAYMLHLLDVGPEDDVLQAAIGAGYETALLAELGQSVSGMEFHRPVAAAAADRLGELGYNVDIREGDIYYGWPEDRRFDAILVRMAMPYVPSPLIDQLRPGGRLVAPIGPDEGPQDLILITKDQDGSIRRERGMSVRFQPLPGGRRL
jgi:protein-L-isoaspartate(D-aspartate) O-methyltransferase